MDIRNHDGSVIRSIFHRYMFFLTLHKGRESILQACDCQVNNLFHPQAGKGTEKAISASRGNGFEK